MGSIDDNIRSLRASFGALKSINPDGELYKRMIALLDRADDNALKVIRDARIPFVSSLALNRIIRRGIEA